MAAALFERLRDEIGGRRAPTSGSLPGYALGRLLAAGSGGEVYLARQLGAANRTVALKRLAPGADSAVVARLRREGEILASLDHPHIVRIYELVPDGDSVAIAMQYARGGSLADRLSRHGRLSSAQVVALASRCADALASAHRRGVLHRDVKPANILFTSDGEPLLSDFGVARWGAASGLTRQGMTLGTAGYLDPDVLDGGEPTVRSDVYSLGIVCYEALVGRPPFRGFSEVAVMKAADRGDFVPLTSVVRDLPPALAVVVERAMAREPSHRFADADELARALRGALRGASVAGTLLGAPRADRPQTSPIFESAPPNGTERSACARSERLESSSGGDDVAATGLFGPRPPEPPAPRPPRFARLRRIRLPHPRLRRLPRLHLRFPRHHRRAVALAAALTLGLIVYAARPSPAARPALDQSVCPATPFGDCDVQATLTGNVIELQPGPGRPATRFSIGEPGDVALLGDWHCRGNLTPAIYRPSTGQVFVFEGWANPNRALTSSEMAAAAPNGRPVVVRSPRGCDHIEVRPN